MGACEMKETRVAVLGLGTMGAGIAHRLLETGFPVGVWNRTPAAADELRAHGATAHPTAPAAVAEAEVVITMLPNEAALEEVVLRRGTLQAMPPHAAWAQMGTIGIEATDRFANEVARRRSDVEFVDAPVSGSRQPARTGKLVIYASGSAEAKGTLGPVFEAIGERILWLGRAGAGSRMKLVMNTLLGFEVEAVAEIHAVASRLGVTDAALADALTGSALASGFQTAKLAKMESGDDSPDFSLQWALKDLDLAVSAAGRSSAPVAASIADRWRELVAEGHGRLDVSAARLGLEAAVRQR